jgi:hypothetical protein
MWRYARSKVCNILFAKELNRRLSCKNSCRPGEHQIYLNCYFPGNIATDAMDTWKMLLGSAAGWAFKTFFKFVGQGVEDAAATVMFLAASEAVVEKGIKGKYFVPVASEASVSKLCEDEKLAKEVWEWTEQMIERALVSRRSLSLTKLGRKEAVETGEGLASKGQIQVGVPL